jgi:hypothetical protein
MAKLWQMTLEPKHSRHLALLALLAACAHPPQSQQAQAASPPAAATARAASSSPPADLIAIAQLGVPRTQMARVRNFAGAIMPGLGGTLDERMLGGTLARLIGMPSLDGMDPDKPVELLALDVRGHSQPFAIVVAVADAARLTAQVTQASGMTMREQGGLAVIGPSKVVAAAGDYALVTLPRLPTPADPTITIFLQTLVRLHESEIERSVHELERSLSTMGSSGGSLSGIMKVEVDLMMDFLHQSDRLTLSVAAGADAASLDFAIKPIAGTTLESFAQSQRPSEDDMVDALPGGATGLMVGGGTIDFKQLRPLMASFMPAVWKMMGKQATPALMQASLGMMDLMTGPFAMTMTTMALGGKMEMLQVMAVSDGHAALQHMLEVYDVLASEPLDVGAGAKSVRMSMKVKRNAARIGSTPVMEVQTTYDMSRLDRAERAQMERTLGRGSVSLIAATDHTLVMALGPGGLARMRAQLEHHKGAGSLNPDVARARARSRALKESGFFVADLPGLVRSLSPQSGASLPIAQANLELGYGFADRMPRMRITFPVPARNR